MLQSVSRRITVLYNVLFVMMEGAELEARPSQWKKVVIISILDALQVLRVLTAQSIGWSDTSIGVIEKFDLLHWTTVLVSTVVPRYVFFALASLLVAGFAGLIGYTGKLFDAGNVQKMWPVKLCRIGIDVMVMALFPTILQWLLLPFSCRISDAYYFSEDIGGAPHSCEYWSFPEILASVVSIIVILLHTLIAAVATNFCLQVNILSRTPSSTYTGYVDLCFLCLKVLSACGVFACDFISPTAVSVILTLVSVHTLKCHLQMLPYHYHNSNILKGGILGMISFSCFSGVIVSVIEGQLGQWILLALFPISFLFGCLLVHISHARILHALDRLRGEWEEKQLGLRSETSSEAGGNWKGAKPGQPKIQTTKSRAFDYFFDTAWERKRAFSSGLHALTCTRTLLYQRNKSEVLFLQYVSERGCKEYPRYQRLQFYQMLLMEFVYNQPTDSALEQKRMKSNQESYSLELRYVLYAAERKGVQDSAAATLGTDGQISAINLMEFNTGLHRAKDAHLQCIVEMKQFWRAVSRNSRKDQVENMVMKLEDFRKNYLEAYKEYQVLLYKYPTSGELLWSYASFADVIMNDGQEAEQKRGQAAALSDDANIREEDVQLLDQEEARTGISGGSGGSNSRRNVVQRMILGFRDKIMSKEKGRVSALNIKIQVCVLLVVATATTAFILSDFILFKNMAKKEMHMIATIGDMRTSAVSACFWLRSMVLESWFGHGDLYKAIAQEGHYVSEHIAEENVYIHSNIAFAEADVYYNHKMFQARIPTAGNWSTRNFTLWELGNDFARRADLAFSTTTEELEDFNYQLAVLSDQKRNIPYVFENFFRTVTPAYEGLQKLYIHEMEVIKDTTDLLVSINASINTSLLIIIIVIFIRELTRYVHKMEHKRTFSLMAASLPKPTARKMYDFYKESERKFREMEDEDLEKQNLEEDLANEVMNGENEMDGIGHGDLEMSSDPHAAPWNYKMSSEFVSNKDQMDHPLPLARVDSSRSVDSKGHMVAPLTMSNVQKFISRDRSSSPAPGSNSSDIAENTRSKFPELNSPTEDHTDNQKSLAKITSKTTPLGSACSDDDMDGSSSTQLAGAGCKESSDEEGTEKQQAREIEKLLSEADQETKQLVDQEGSEHEPEDLKVSFGAANEEAAERQDKAPESNQDDEEGSEVVSDILNENNRFSSIVVVDRPPSKKVASIKDELQCAPRSPWDPGSDSSKGSQKERARVKKTTKFEDDGPSTKERDVKKSASFEDGSEIEEIDQQEATGSFVKRVVMKDDVEDNSDSLIKKVRPGDRSPILKKTSKDRASQQLRVESQIKDDDEEKSKASNASSRISKPASSYGRKKSASFRANFTSSLFGAIGFHQEQPHGYHLDSSSSPAHHKSRNQLRTEDEMDAIAETLDEILETKRAWFDKVSIYGAVFLVVMVLSLLSSFYPSRNMGTLITLAPIVDQAGRREELVRACIMYARELMLDDGLSRHDKQELSNALSFLIDDLRVTDMAVRLGKRPDRNIIVGADDRNEVHNEVMYGHSCPWQDGSGHRRSNPYLNAKRAGSAPAALGEGREPTPTTQIDYVCPDDLHCCVPEKPGASGRGLLYLHNSFIDAAESILLRFGVPPKGDLTAFEHLRLDTHHDADFDEVHVHFDMMELLDTDADMTFMLACFNGELFTGLKYVETLFDHEMDAILDGAVHDNDFLFGLYVISVVFLFYLMLFRRTSSKARKEAELAKLSVLQMPAHILTDLEIQNIRAFFVTDDEETREGEEDDK